VVTKSVLSIGGISLIKKLNRCSQFTQDNNGEGISRIESSGINLEKPIVTSHRQA
jgi:hypothetical protein